MKKIYTLAAFALSFLAFATNHAVSVVNNSYSPATLAIAVGDTVTWTQVNGVHNVNGSTSTYASNPASFGNGAAAGGTWTYQYVFTVPGSYQYQCDPHASFMTGSITVTAAATTVTPCTEFFISEYVEGSSNNKALEIYNPTGAAKSIAGYTLALFSNGATTTTNTFVFPAGTTIPAHGTYVIAHGSGVAALLAVADTSYGYPNVVSYNGNDAVVLLTPTNDTLDIIGIVGVDPGSNWTVGSGATNEYTLVRKVAIEKGQLDWAIGATEWDVYPQNTFTQLGAHTSNCATTTISPSIRFASAAASALEGNVTEQVYLVINPTYASASTVTLSHNAGAGFVVGSDASFNPSISATGTSITVPAGADTVALSITIIDDALTEGDEHIDLLIDAAGTGLQVGAIDSMRFTIIDNDIIIPTYTIPQIKGQDANGVNDSNGVYCKVIGTVLGVNTQSASTGNVAFTIHDGNVGFGVFSPASANHNYSVNEGDVVRIIGTIGQFNGLAQVNADSIAIVSTGAALPTPTTIVALDESTESDLLRMNNVTIANPAQWTNAGSGFNVDITDGTNTIQLRIDADVDLYSQPCPVGTFDVVGIGGQFDNSNPYTSGYQMLPRYIADVIFPTPMSYDLAVTEIMAGSNDPNSNVSEDWFEILNYGSTAVNLDGFSWDDNSLAPGTSTFQNVTIAPGEAIVVWAGVQANERDFKAAWSLTNTNVQVISSDELVNGAYPSLSSSSDVVVLFDTSANPIEICKAEYTSTLAGHSVEFDTNCTYLGNASVGVRGAYTSAGTDVGSPGNQTISVGENSLEKVSLYPNPAGTLATLKLPMDGSKSVTVLNALGQPVLSQRTSQKELTLQVGSLKAGIYMVRIQSEAGQRTLRLIVQH